MKSNRIKRRIEMEREGEGEKEGGEGQGGLKRKTQGCSLVSGSRTLVRLAVEFE